MSTIVEVQDHKKFPRSKWRNKQGNDEEEKDAHIIIIDNPLNEGNVDTHFGKGAQQQEVAQQYGKKRVSKLRRKLIMPKWRE